MGKRSSQATKNLERQLISDARFYLDAVQTLTTDFGLSDIALGMIERRALDMIAFVQQYRHANKVLFTQGQKS